MTIAHAPRIAVVDDDGAFLDLMADILGDEGYQPLVWKVASGAYGYLRQQQPDLLILDLHMNDGMSGWEVLHQLKLDASTSQIPVIVCSADVSFLRSHADWLHQQGYTALEKPFDLDDMLATVDKVLPLNLERCA